MAVVGMIGAGHMGSGLGWALREAGHDVITSLDGRSERTATLAAQAGLRVVPSLADVVTRAGFILVVTPPEAALTVAASIAGVAAELTGRLTQAERDLARPVVADLNAIAPRTARAVGDLITQPGLDFVDGSISGPPPTVRPGTKIYLSGSRAADIAGLGWRHVHPIVVGPEPGTASAVKMCTASVYKGLTGLLTQAMRAASANGVLDAVLADLGDGYGSPYSVAMAATKSGRYVAEMREIAAFQADAGLPAALFEAYAQVWFEVSGTALAHADPERVDRAISADEVIRRLRDGS